MNDLQHRIIYELTGHENIDQASISDLHRLTTEYPYFAAAHFALSAKQQATAHHQKEKQLQRTALQFPNLHWLHYQLHQQGNLAISMIDHQPTEQPVQPLLTHVVEEEMFTSNNVVTIAEENSATERQPSFIVPTVESVKDLLSSIETKETTPVLPEIEEEIPLPVIEEKQAEPEVAPIIAAPATYERESVVSIAEEATTEVTEEDIPEIEEGTITTDPVAAEKLSSILDEQLAEFKKEVKEDTPLEITPEVYHTIDYFASQGIKPEFDQQTNDKLAKQLRKFTDWLKHMKNAPPQQDGDLGTDPELETAIHGIAQTSNQPKEIVTETMAEVLEKQGKTDKAIQLYIKLSFLNPDKSAYFADKIQQLKGI